MKILTKTEPPVPQMTFPSLTYGLFEEKREGLNLSHEFYSHAVNTLSHIPHLRVFLSYKRLNKKTKHLHHGSTVFKTTHKSAIFVNLTADTLHNLEGFHKGS